tara:strand:+ start:1502 stop:1765 length:264 start_codon:yes stop_codon:yes gene_type:complete
MSVDDIGNVVEQYLVDDKVRAERIRFLVQLQNEFAQALASNRDVTLEKQYEDISKLISQMQNTQIVMAQEMYNLLKLTLSRRGATGH